MPAQFIVSFTSSIPFPNRGVPFRRKYHHFKNVSKRCMLEEKDVVGSYKYMNMSLCPGSGNCYVSPPTIQIERLRSVVESRLNSLGDGDISISPYDTAWVALVEDLQGGGAPQFPSSLKWISDNQLPDGSWGDRDYFSAYDRLLNTLACAIALKRWNSHHHQSERGLKFVNDNICKLENEKSDHMTIAFEVLFPALMDLAQGLDMDVPSDSPVMQNIYALRAKKLKSIPRDVLHTIHTTLLFSLEGFPDLDWEKLLKLQSSDGSFWGSPSSTAFALAHTKDTKSLNYIEKNVERFNGGAPLIYPVDLFARNWAIDRLQRLGVSRYFETEFKEFMSYVYRQWTGRGIFSARDSPLFDIDDTAMSFRLLRMHGYEVPADVFQHFRNGDKFVTFSLQTTESVTSMFQLYRASQVSFPGEKILKDAKEYSYNFLRERHSKNQVFDKWLICKDLPGEVSFSLDVPWYACLPRVETRSYLEQYGGESDRWIGKVLYSMNDINNNNYLELAKLDYNYCQEVLQHEWNGIQKWFEDHNLEALQISRELVLFAYFLASASIFEPERSKERLAWAKTSILIEMLSVFLEKEIFFNEQKKVFLQEINSLTEDHDDNYSSETANALKVTFLKIIEDLSLEAPREDHKYVYHHLRVAWTKWLIAWEERKERCPEDAQLIVKREIRKVCSGRFTEEMSLHPQYERLSSLANKICHQLKPWQNNQMVDDRTSQVDKDMQELVQQVLLNSPNNIDSGIKQTFLMVCKSFYYRNFFSPDTIRSHIDKVLFQRVD